MDAFLIYPQKFDKNNLKLNFRNMYVASCDWQLGCKALE